MNRITNLAGCLASRSRPLWVAGICLALGISAVSSANGAPIFLFSGNSSDTHPVSGSAEFTLNPGADTVTVKLSNTTSTTLDAGELFTGLDFSIGGLAPAMTSDTGIQRTVDANGNFTDTLTPQDLSWSLVALGDGSFQLNFNPDAKDSIIGPPTGGNYSGASGSIKGNNGHNPFAAEMAVFELSVPNLEAGSTVAVTTFRYGTTLNPATGKITQVPEPSTIAVMLLGLVGVGLISRRPVIAD